MLARGYLLFEQLLIIVLLLVFLLLLSFLFLFWFQLAKYLNSLGI